jgi:hypothetical protein
MAGIAARRKLEDLSIGPVLTWTTRAMLDHVDRLLQIPGACRLARSRQLLLRGLGCALLCAACHLQPHLPCMPTAGSSMVAFFGCCFCV